MWRGALVLLLASAAVRAEEPRIALRAAEHPGRSRVVLEWPGTPEFRAEQQGERLLLRLPPGRAPAEVLRRLPRNLQGMAVTDEGLLLTLRPGVQLRQMVMDRRLVLDLGDAPPGAAAAPPEAPAAAPVPRRTATPTPTPTLTPVLRSPRPGRAAPPPEPMLSVAPREQPVQLPFPAPQAAALASPASPAAALPAPTSAAAPVEAALGPMPAAVPALAPEGALVLRLLPAVANQPPALLLPYAEATPAAMLRRGEALLLAFASPRPLDLAALRGNPLFAQAEALAVPGGMVLRLPLAAPAAATARREGTGWSIQLSRGEPGGEELRALTPEVTAGPPARFALLASKPGPTLAMADPETGLPLLLGTVAEAGQAVPLPRRLVEFELPGTLLGMAVLARADSVTLVPLKDRFAVAGSGGMQLALDPAAAAAEPGARGMTRSFELPAGSVAELANRLRGQRGGIAGAAPLARAPARREAAATLLALGLMHEAQAMAGLAMAEDPVAAADPQLLGLAAAAALLAGRPEEARALREAGLPETDEMTLWRAALAATELEPARAAPGFAATLPLLQDYPLPLRQRLLPLAAEALAEAGDTASLTRLLAPLAAAALPLPRAMLAEAEGKTAAALAGYAAAARGNDRRVRALALRRGIDLQLASGAIDAAAAAKALDATLFAWRGDAVELAARKRLAELRVAANQPREALTLLEESAALFPEQAGQLQAPMVAALLAALAQEPPLAAVTLHDSHAALLAEDPRGDEAAVLLAERLVALDLTERAAMLLARAADRAEEPARRAALGLRLAALKLDEGDASAALTALETTRAEGLAEPLSRERVVLAARAEARRGKLDKAQEALAQLGPAGDAPLAELLADAQDWPAAAAAGGRAVAALPAGTLNAEQQRLVLRQAALLVLAGDEAGVAALRGAASGRLAGQMGDAFVALSAESLRGLADLPRLAREQQLFRNMPRRLEALRAGAPVTR